MHLFGETKKNNITHIIVTDNHENEKEIPRPMLKLLGYIMKSNISKLKIDIFNEILIYKRLSTVFQFASLHTSFTISNLRCHREILQLTDLIHLVVL